MQNPAVILKIIDY